MTITALELGSVRRNSLPLMHSIIYLPIVNVLMRTMNLLRGYGLRVIVKMVGIIVECTWPVIY
jgi:hypothetical protein